MAISNKLNQAMRLKTILVTDSHNLAGLGAIRSLTRAGYSVIAGYAQDQQRPAGAWSRYWITEMRYPNPRTQQFEFRAWLRDEANRGSFDTVLPVSEASVVGVASVRNNSACGFLPILPDDSSLEYTLSKFRSTSLALSLGVNCPATEFVFSGEPEKKWNSDFSGLLFPIIIKTDNHLTAEGMYQPGRKFFAADASEATKILEELEGFREGIIAQEVIPGYGTGAFLLRFNGKIHLSFAHRRLHEVPYSGGVSSFRQSIVDDELVKIGARILDAMNYNGVAMIEFRRSSKDGRPYFLEINGRLWGSLALALHSGADFPKALIECYESGVPTRSEYGYRSGVKCRNVFRGELAHVLSILKAKPGKSAQTRPSKIKAIATFVALSFNPTIRHDYFWWSDPFPALVQATLAIRWITIRTIERLRNYKRSRKLRKWWLQHELRSRRPKYFNSLPKTVLFLCYGNICRSPFAEHLWNAKIRQRISQGPTAASAGLHTRGNRKSPNWAVELAAERGVNLNKHRSRVVTKVLVDSVDAIFVMDQMNYRELMRQFPTAKHKTYFLGLFGDNGQIEIHDPFTMSKARARSCYQQLADATEGLMKRFVVSQDGTADSEPPDVAPRVSQRSSG